MGNKTRKKRRKERQEPETVSSRQENDEQPEGKVVSMSAKAVVHSASGLQLKAKE